MNQQEKNLFIARQNDITQEENAFWTSIEAKKKQLAKEVNLALRRQPIRSIIYSQNGYSDLFWMHTAEYSISGITVSGISSGKKIITLPLKDIPVTIS